MERSTIFHGKIHYFDWAIFNSKLSQITRGYLGFQWISDLNKWWFGPLKWWLNRRISMKMMMNVGFKGRKMVMWSMKSCDLFGNKWNSPQIEFVLVGRICLWSYLIFVLKNVTPDVAPPTEASAKSKTLNTWRWPSGDGVPWYSQNWMMVHGTHCNPIVVGLALQALWQFEQRECHINRCA